MFNKIRKMKDNNIKLYNTNNEELINLTIVDGVFLGVPILNDKPYKTSSSSYSNKPNIITNELTNLNKKSCSLINGIWDDKNNRCVTETLFRNSNSSTYTLSLSTDGVNGSFFGVSDEDKCSLKVSFDFLLNFDCETLLLCGNQGEVCDILSVINGISLTSVIETTGMPNIPINPIDTDPFIDPNTNISLESNINAIPVITSTPTLYPVSPENFYIIDDETLSQENTGILLTGENCDDVIECIANGLGDDCYILSANTFNSNWLHYEYVISDENALAQIENEYIQFGITINGCSCDFSLLLDNIELNKICVKKTLENQLINSCPSFDLVREIDNKKSWVNINDSEHRTYFNLPERNTNYDTAHERLVINTKEVDLNLDAANSIECAVFDFLHTSGGTCVLDYIIDSGSTNSCSVCDNNFLTFNPPKLTVNQVPGCGSMEMGGGLMFLYNNDVIFDPVTPVILPIQDNGVVDEHLANGALTTLISTNNTSNGSDGWFWSSRNGELYNYMNCRMYQAIGSIGAILGIHKFIKCVEIPVSKIYYISLFGVENNLYIDGILVFDYSTYYYSRGVNIFPIYLTQGSHEFKFISDWCNIGFEIYDNTALELTGNTYSSTGVGNLNIIYSTGYDGGNYTGNNEYGKPIAYEGYDCGECDLNICEATCTTTCVSGTSIPINQTINELLITEISGITDVQTFVEVMLQELIDVKNRKVLQSYPTLKWLYEAYLGLVTDCGLGPNQFTYCDLNEFIGIVNSYWYELFEQVIPATTIWGATTIYRNSIFDQQKFQYKRYSLNPCNNFQICEIVGSGTTNVDITLYEDIIPDPIITGGTDPIIITGITDPILVDPIGVNPATSGLLKTKGATVRSTFNPCNIPSEVVNCDNLYIYNMDDGSSFVGQVNILSPRVDVDPGIGIADVTIIKENNEEIDIIKNNIEKFD